MLFTLEMAVLEHFLVKHSQGTLGVKKCLGAKSFYPSKKTTIAWAMAQTRQVRHFSGSYVYTAIALLPLATEVSGYLNDIVF